MNSRPNMQDESAASDSTETPNDSECDAGDRFDSSWARLPFFSSALARMPMRSRPALFFETFYNIGSGSFISLLALSTVALKTVLDGTETHLAILAAMFGGSSLLSPFVSYLGRTIRMQALVVWPNFLVALILIATVVSSSPTWFTACVGMAFVIRVFPRVGEMNMYRILYPPTCRGAAVGWIKCVAALSGLGLTLLGYWCFTFHAQHYWVLYCISALLLTGAAWSYKRIPVSTRSVFVRKEHVEPHRAFMDGLSVFFKDKRFLAYQFGFALAGTGNHLAYVFVPQVLKETVLPMHSQFTRFEADAIVGLVGAVLPAVFLIVSSVMWGRFLDKVNPMQGRAVFNAIQFLGFCMHAYGGISRQIWPFAVGAILLGISGGGSTINWLTGSLYFAKNEHISLYNAIHVGLTGIRGLIAPLIGLYLFRSEGLNWGSHIFTVAALLSLAGAVVMTIQGFASSAPREPMAQTR